MLSETRSCYGRAMVVLFVYSKGIASSGHTGAVALELIGHRVYSSVVVSVLIHSSIIFKRCLSNCSCKCQFAYIELASVVLLSTVRVSFDVLGWTNSCSVMTNMFLLSFVMYIVFEIFRCGISLHVHNKCKSRSCIFVGDPQCFLNGCQ